MSTEPAAGQIIAIVCIAALHGARVEAAPDPFDESVKLPRGSRIEVTQVRQDAKTGVLTYFAHGAGCYESTNLEFIFPCRIGAQYDHTMGDEAPYFNVR